jgi:hypothetical protein
MLSTERLLSKLILSELIFSTGNLKPMNNLPSSKNRFPLHRLSFSSHVLTLFSLAVCFVMVGKTNPVEAKETRQYTGITQEKFNTCVKTNKNDQGYAKYLDGNIGKVELWATIPFEDWVAGTLNYKFDPSKNTLEYRLIKANFPASPALIWDGLNKMIQRCGGKV